MASASTKESLFECSLFGKLEPKGFDRLRERVIAICGTDFMEIRHHEVVLVPSITTPVGPARNDDVTLRCRSPYKSRTQGSREQIWQIFKMGTPEARPGQTVTVRPVIYAPFFGNPLKYAYTMGYISGFETAKEGYTYFYNDNISINMYRLYKLGKKYDLSTLYNIDSEDSWVIEVSSTPIKVDEINQATTDIKAIQVYLQGLVDLEYVDHLILENKITYRSHEVQ